MYTTRSLVTVRTQSPKTLPFLVFNFDQTRLASDSISLTLNASLIWQLPRLTAVEIARTRTARIHSFLRFARTFSSSRISPYFRALPVSSIGGSNRASSRFRLLVDQRAHPTFSTRLSSVAASRCVHRSDLTHFEAISFRTLHVPAAPACSARCWLP